MTATITGLLDQRGFFKDFPDEVKQALSQQARTITLQDKEQLYRAGDEPRGLYGIISGGIKLSSQDNQGNLYIYGVTQPGWWIGEIAALDGEKHAQIANAVGNTELILIPRKILLDCLATHPKLNQLVISMLCKRLRAVGKLVEDAAITPLPIRLAKTLIRLHKSHNGQTAKLSQEEIAASLGVTRQSIHRILKEWQEQQWISVGYGDIGIIKPESLIALIENN